MIDFWGGGGHYTAGRYSICSLLHLDSNLDNYSNSLETSKRVTGLCFNLAPACALGYFIGLDQSNVIVSFFCLVPYTGK